MAAVGIPADDCVHFYYAILSPAVRAELRRRCRSILPPEELQRARRIRSPWRREHFMAARLLLRKVLARLLHMEPQELIFQAEEQGKPVLAVPSTPDLQFSLSHSARMVACAVASARPIGVDVESAGNIRPPMEVVERFFDPAEAALLLQLSGRQRTSAFLTLWTLKEAFAKAQGQGLHPKCLKTSFFWYLDKQIRKSDIRTVSERSLEDWQFAVISLHPGYHAALAVHSPGDERLFVRVREIEDLK